TADASGLSGTPVTFTATATSSAATTLTKNAGDNQTTTVATAVATAPSVLVTDGTNPVSGVSVTFAVATGGGTISSPSGATVLTNASGIAALSSWVLGTPAGTNNNTATATVSARFSASVTFTANATPGAASQIALNAGNNQSATVSASVTTPPSVLVRSEEHTSELQSPDHLVCRLLLEKK